MFEYAFFDSESMQGFIAAAAERGVTCTTREDPVAGTIVAIPDDVPDEVLDALDELYEGLLAQQSASARDQEGWVNKRLAGVQVLLADGSLRTVRLDPETANRLLAAFTPEEAQALVQAIVRSLENPLEGPLCRMPAP